MAFTERTRLSAEARSFDRASIRVITWHVKRAVTAESGVDADLTRDGEP
jgi:hypothetical protein